MFQFKSSTPAQSSAYEAFQDVQDRYLQNGGFDTEVMDRLEWILTQARNGAEIQWENMGIKAWQLFTDVPDSDQAAKALTDAAKVLYDLIKENK